MKNRTTDMSTTTVDEKPTLDEKEREQLKLAQNMVLWMCDHLAPGPQIEMRNWIQKLPEDKIMKEIHPEEKPKTVNRSRKSKR